MATATASAPGKLILFGEHAVVYGATAVAGALSDLRASTTAEAATDGRVTITVPDLAALAAGAAPSATPSSSHSWPLEAVRAALAPVLAAARDAAPPSALEPCPVRPTPAVTAAVDALVAECEDAGARKAHGPVLFLVGGILLATAGDAGGATELGGLRVTVHPPTLPVGAGLGSSAGFSVSTAGALLHLRAKLRGRPDGLCSASGAAAGSSSDGSGAAAAPAPPGEWAAVERESLAVVNEWAYCCECLFHGVPSGLDNTVSTYGGALAYKRILPPAGSSAPATTQHSRVEGMPTLRLLVTNTRVPKETGKLVAGVRALREALPAPVDHVIAAIQAISEGALAAIAKAAAAAEGDSATTPAERDAALFRALGGLASLNHGLLNALGVGHESLDYVVAESRREGLPAKLTGAGGGGCALTLLPPPGVAGDDAARAAALTRLRAAMSARAYDCFETGVGGHGLLLRRDG